MVTDRNSNREYVMRINMPRVSRFTNSTVFHKNNDSYYVELKVEYDQ